MQVRLAAYQFPLVHSLITYAMKRVAWQNACGRALKYAFSKLTFRNVGCRLVIQASEDRLCVTHDAAADGSGPVGGMGLLLFLSGARERELGWMQQQLTP